MKQTTLNLNAAREVDKWRVCFLSIVSAVKHKLFDVDGRLLTIDTIFKESDKLFSLSESITFELLNVQVKQQININKFRFRLLTRVNFVSPSSSFSLLHKDLQLAWLGIEKNPIGK